MKKKSKNTARTSGGKRGKKSYEPPRLTREGNLRLISSMS